MHFSPYSILPLVTSTTVLSLGVLVFFRSSNTKINGIFLIWCTSVFVWLFSYSIVYSIVSLPVALILIRIACAAVMCFSIIFYHFTVIFLDIRKEMKFVRPLYVVTLAIVPVELFTNYFIIGAQTYFFGFYGKASPTYIFLIIFFLAVMVRPLSLLIRAVKNKSTNDKRLMEIKYILAAFAIAYIASIDFLPKFGIEIYPVGAMFILCWAITMSYAILKHQLLDINIVLRKGLIYSLLVAILTIFYLLVIVISEDLFESLLGYKSVAISIFLTALIAAFFIPLKNRIQDLVDKLFFKGTLLEIAQENDSLRREVAQSEKHKAVAALASGIAHEVRNPLTALKTFYEHFPRKKDDPEFIAKFTHIAGKEIGRIEGLIQQLLDFAKPSPPSFRETDINKLVRDTLDLLVNKLESNNIQLNQHLSPDNYHLKIDPNQFKQALLNIFLNAIDAMSSGGQLTVSSLVDRTSYIVSIADTGSGIAPEDLKHIFEPFFSKKASGTGLGLAITQGIMEQHKGKIRIESTVGVGTTVVLEFPLEHKN
ncbi:MAG: hypothetical protein HZA28_01140 [Candidatus Omnitrophica bacterium]|nr:hypothetical protein [Candidatus Omnitrophota bacterium]